MIIHCCRSRSSPSSTNVNMTATAAPEAWTYSQTTRRNSAGADSDPVAACVGQPEVPVQGIGNGRLVIGKPCPEHQNRAGLVGRSEGDVDRVAPVFDHQ